MDPKVMKVIFVSFAFIILGCSIGYLKKDKYKYGLLCICMSFILVLADPESFQGFLKTGLDSTLKAFGREICRVHDTLAVQQSTLDSNRVQIASQQITLDSNNVQIAVLQSSLMNAQSNILSQQRTIDTQRAKVISQQAFLDSQQLALNSQQVTLNSIQANLNSIQAEEVVTGNKTASSENKTEGSKQ
jgi:hypothetical protein